MTAVVGVVADGRVWIGADRATVWEDDDCRLQITRNPKVFRVGTLLLGSSGSGRVQNILRCLTVPKRPPGVSAFNYVALTVAGAIRRALLDAGALVPAARTGEDDGSPETMPLDTSILVGYRRGLYRIDDDFSCDEPADELDAIGSGRSHALARLSGPGEPKARILAALRSAERNCWSVRRPFDVECL